jgi:hypothetical protein
MEEVKFAVLLVLSIAITLASIVTLNEVLLAFALAVVTTVALLYRLWYVIEAVMFKHTRMIELFGGYELGGARETAIRKLDGAFSATAAALLATSAKRGVDISSVESIIQQTRAPFKFVLQIERLSAKKILDAMQTKISMKRLEVSKLSASYSKRDAERIEVLKKETAELEKEVKAISASAPMRLHQYIMTSARSENRFTASEQALMQIRELSSRFGAFLGAEPVLLSGNELMAVLELDSTMVE